MRLNEPERFVEGSGIVRQNVGVVGRFYAGAHGSGRFSLALRHRVDMRVALGAETIEHFMKGDEVRPAQISVRRLGGKVDGVCEPRVQHRDDRGSVIRRNVVSGLSELHIQAAWSAS